MSQGNYTQEYVSLVAASWAETYWQDGHDWQAEIVRRLQDYELSLIVADLSGEPLPDFITVHEECCRIVNSLRKDVPHGKNLHAN